jgi:hypothetical protein
MSVQLTLADRLQVVVVPTTAQTLASLFVALVFLIAVQSQLLLKSLGITGPILTAAQKQFHDRLDILLTLPIVSQITLITFWAAIGLVAYLLCWGVYNILIEARNEVTLTTAYTNRGNPHWRGPRETLGLKAAAALGLALMIGSLRFGLPFWLAVTGQALSRPTPLGVIWAILSVAGLALQLYLILVFIQLTFTPWYRIQTFTDV